MEANVGMGRDILRYQDVLVERIARRAEVYEIDAATVWDSERAWKKVVAVNTPILQSKVLAKLYEEHPEAVTFAWSQRNGQIHVSFRSKPGEGPDVGRLAESFGGGGHKHAAGCTVSAYSWAAFYFARRVALRLDSEERGADAGEAAVAKARGEVRDED